MTPAIHAVFATWPNPQRNGLEHLRRLILTQAALLPEIGRVTEELRWGQPAYLTPDAHTACSLRIGMAKQDFALFVHCRTNLIETFAAGPGAGMRFQGTRAVLFRSETEIKDDPLSFLIRAALTYHLAV
ncbi:MAG: DUF1801 domain-containing protein [Paracoccaceae bacterium]